LTELNEIAPNFENVLEPSFLSNETYFFTFSR
jgi:hypothetical protein